MIAAATLERMSGLDLRGERKALDMTQEALADALGVTANTVARWERGDLTIAHPGVLRLALRELRRRHRRASK